MIKNIPMNSISGEISYDDVSFRFGSSGPLQLSKIELSVNAGEFVASWVNLVLVNPH